jgi:hypothetical protein
MAREMKIYKSKTMKCKEIIREVYLDVKKKYEKEKINLNRDTKLDDVEYEKFKGLITIYVARNPIPTEFWGKLRDFLSGVPVGSTFGDDHTIQIIVTPSLNVVDDLQHEVLISVSHPNIFEFAKKISPSMPGKWKVTLYKNYEVDMEE